ncbi:NlpC/P60 family protein [bacterium]|nr:MAG: NlpC/P60 family protein [bacterium]
MGHSLDLARRWDGLSSNLNLVSSSGSAPAYTGRFRLRLPTRLFAAPPASSYSVSPGGPVLQGANPLAAWRLSFQLFQGPALSLAIAAPKFAALGSTAALRVSTASKNALALTGLTASARVLEALHFIEKRVKTTVYNHKTQVDFAKGQFEFDCSGMVNWILQQAAPTAYAELKSERPRVAEYVKALKKIPYDQPSAGWRRVQKIADAEPGDVIAWPTPDWYPSDATGHMGIVAAKPEKVSGGYLIRIADATSLPHGEDSREGGTGFGYGDILITVDPDTGAGTGQGWTGRYSANTVIKTPIYVGRPLQ